MRRYRDEITGDELTLGEYVSWKVQAVIRRWLFIGLITALTAFVWLIADPIWHHPVTDQWNLWASYLAILIESVTAMALINQCKRDAVVVRENRAISRNIESITKHIEQQFERIKAIEIKTGVLAKKIDEVK